MRKSVFLAAAILVSTPLISFAQVTSNYFVATDSAATSSFSGALSVSGQMQLPSLVDGVVSSVGGYLSTASNFVYNAATGFLGVGTSTQDVNSYWEFVQQTSTGGGSNLTVTNYNSGSGIPGAELLLRGARGTETSPTAIHTSDTLGRIGFSGFDGTAFSAIAPVFISAFAQDNWTSSDHGAGMNFFVTAPGTTTRSLVMQLNGSGLTVTSGAISANGGISGASFASSGSIVANPPMGNILIGTTTGELSLATFDGSVYAAGGYETMHITSSGTTTVKIDSISTSTQGACLVMKDSDGGGYTYITTYRGTLIASTSPCN